MTYGVGYYPHACHWYAIRLSARIVRRKRGEDGKRGMVIGVTLSARLGRRLWTAWLVA